MMEHNIKPLKRVSFREEVYQALKRAIVHLELKPGQRLHDQELAEQFGISRTPVREALKRLEDEGLVEAVPGSATRGAPLKPEEAKHAFTVTAALHALAVKLSIPFLTKADIKQLEAHNRSLKHAIEKEDIIEAIESDEAFHRVFLKASKNPEITRALERIASKIYRLEMSQFSSVSSMKSVEQHRQMIDACRKKDAETAVRLAEENWLSLGDRLAGHQEEE
ncbi:GntR family transcriptional regulator [Bacillus sonorensis]|uniref:GntR family transcriptional regulator n=1 Tax=Bacillus sonorensis TaxID=119858 RepID=UPI00227E8FDC|nr:GntR family transcriptional regulator [Bacillus sonorensis]MCY8606564.1 GntR family transcriptional regulator [Bacillus sonorensis]